MNDPRDLLSARGLSPKRSFGQNFLRDKQVLERIAETCVPTAERGLSYVVEIGAGTGALTEVLLQRAATVVAIERDRDLLPVLQTRFQQHLELPAHAGRARLQLEECDAKQAPYSDWFAAVPAGSRVLCGNLPYQLTGFLLERAIACGTGIDRAVFLVQDEVALRLVAEPGSKDYGALTVFTAAAFRARCVVRVGPQAFFPQPQVWSAVVELLPRRDDGEKETVEFRELVKRAFHMRRKTLRNAWRGIAEESQLEAALVAVGSSLDARGETLNFRQFGAVARAVAQVSSGG
jgi:16S rRNA (adenine1518-N6/adenine1519-N6)-dimethyltransferase